MIYFNIRAIFSSFNTWNREKYKNYFIYFDVKFKYVFTLNSDQPVNSYYVLVSIINLYIMYASRIVATHGNS